MGEFSLIHWAIILVIVLVIFGPSKLPGLGKGLGEAIRGFKKGLNEDSPTQDTSDPNRQISGSTSGSHEGSTVKKDEKIHS
jgi:sec-independent protein translocase protein TatA